MSTVENNWFHCVSARDCDPEIVKGLLKIFKNQIHMLLETIINLVDNNVINAIPLIIRRAKTGGGWGAWKMGPDRVRAPKVFPSRTVTL